MISLDLSKAFDRVDWAALWDALRRHGVSNDIIWLLQCLYQHQTGTVIGETESSKEFDINAGVRQGCVLSPRLFCCVLQVALVAWRNDVGHLGIDFQDGLAKLLDLRFADDILLFAMTRDEAARILDAIVQALAAVGLLLNPTKTKVLTTEAQPPSTLSTPNGLVVDVLNREDSHKWLGCLLCTKSEGNHAVDTDHHVQAAFKAFFANRWLLCDQKVSLRDRLRYFEAVISPVACFAAAHRPVYKSDLRKLDVAQRRMLRTVVGAPSGTDWSAEWHVILHGWNRRVSEQIQACNISTWSDRCLRSYWRFAQYVVSLPADRWVRRALNWVPNWSRRKGRPRYQWDSMLQNFCRWKRCENWQFEAQDEARWSTLLSDFLSFMEHV